MKKQWMSIATLATTLAATCGAGDRPTTDPPPHPLGHTTGGRDSAAAPGAAAWWVNSTRGRWSLGFDASGDVHTLVRDGNPQQNLVGPTLPAGQPPLVAVELYGAQGFSRPSSVEVNGARILAHFPTGYGNASVVLALSEPEDGEDGFLLVTVEEATAVGAGGRDATAAVWGASGAVLKLRFLALPLAFPLEGCATLAGVGYSATSAVALLPATLNTSVAGMPSSPQKFGPSNPDGANCSLSASAFGDSGFVGASAALWVGPRSQLSAAVQRGERAFGLPSPTLGGRWAKDSDEVKRGVSALSQLPLHASSFEASPKLVHAPVLPDRHPAGALQPDRCM